MPSVNITTTPSKAFEIPQGAWGYRVNNVSDETIYTLENAAVTTSTGIPLAAGAERTVCFAEKAQNAMSLQAVHGGSGNKALRYEILTVQVQAITRTAAAGASFATITGAPTDNAALAAALALKLDKTGGIITGNGAASTPALKFTGTPFSGGTSETTKPLFLLEPSGTTSNNWSTGGTVLGVNAASGFAGDLISAQRNGLVQFSVQANGPTRIIAPSGDNKILILNSRDSYLNDNAYFAIGGSGNLYWNGPLESGGYLRMTVSAGAGEDVYIRADDADILAQREGSNAQTSRLYGTYTDASNYRRLAFGSTTAGVFSIAPEGAGTGASGNVLHISGLPTSNPGPGILWNNAGTPAIGT